MPCPIRDTAPEQSTKPRYSTDIGRLDNCQMDGFFDGWPHPPDQSRHIEFLKRSDLVVMAFDAEEDGRMVGFINCLTDRVLTAYIPLLEVLPDYRHRGIGRELVTRLRDAIGSIYMIDLVCDEDMVPFYTKLGFKSTRAMVKRDFNRQSGPPN